MIDKKLYMWWTGDNDMSDNRKRSIEHVSRTCGVELCVLCKDEIRKYEKQENKFHEAYELLSHTHKGDYLKCYFMHFYGGCYSDIKITNFNWSTYVDILENESEKDVLGYTEIASGHIGIIPGDLEEQNIRNSYNKLIGNGSYICKKNSMITTKWYNMLNEILDDKLDLLKENPSSRPREVLGEMIDGERSKYPFRWAELCGEIFHKICYHNNNRVLHGLPRPVCTNYR